MTRLTDADIRNQVTPESYRRGEPYFKRGAIQGARRSGRVLRAQCEGSRPEPYRVHVELAPAGIAYAHCSCPVGAEGRCKHIAALLIAWLEQPESFAEVEDIEVALAERDSEELRAMLRYVMQRHPELELILEMRFPVGEAGESAELDPQAYRDQARDIFREGAQGLGAPSQIADALKPLLEIARAFEARGDALASVHVNGAVCDEIIAQRERVRDEDGFLDALVVESLDTLFAMLAAREISRAARHGALAILASAATTEHLPEVRLHAERGILSSALDDEDRQELALHLRQRLRQENAGSDAVDSWLLLRLEASRLDDDAFVDRCRNLGRQDALVDHLLERERVEDALAEVERADDAHFLALVEAFTAHGHADKVEPVVERRYEEHGEPRLLEWLGERYAERGESALALSTALARFYRTPSHEAFQRIQQLSPDQKQWELLRPSLLANLRARDEWDVVMRAHMEAEEWDEAAAALRAARQHGQVGANGWIELQLDLASAARAARPHLAGGLYRLVAEQLIEKRSLANFKTAANLLTHAFQIAREHDEREQWDAYFEELLARYGRFQGLREALAAVGL